MVDDQSVKGTGLTLASWLLVSENNKLVGGKPIRVGASLEELGGHHVRMKNRSNVANSSKPNYSPNLSPITKIVIGGVNISQRYSCTYHVL